MSSPIKKRTFFAYIPVNVAQALFAFGTIILFTRLLSPAEYGRYSLMNVTIQLLQGILFFWLNTSIARFFQQAKNQNQVAHLLTTSYLSFTVIVLGLLPMVWLVSLGLDWVWHPLLWVGMVVLVLRSLLQMGLETHRADLKIWRYSWLESSQYLLSLGLGLLLVSWGLVRETGPLAGMALANLFCLLLDMSLLKNIFTPHLFDRDMLYKMTHYGLPLILSSMLSLVLASGDRFMIEWLLDSSAVGIYSVAYALADRPLTILFTAISMAALPMAFKALESEGVAATQRIIRQNGELLLFLTLPAAAGMIMTAKPAIYLLVGTHFQEQSILIFPWVVLGSLFNGWSMHYAVHAFLLGQRTRALVGCKLVPALVNIGLNLIWIPRFGLMGAAWATIASYLLSLILHGVWGRRYFPLPFPVKALLKTTLATGFMVLALYLASFPDTLWGLGMAIVMGGGFMPWRHWL